jgi:hypothetical protein
VKVGRFGSYCLRALVRLRGPETVLYCVVICHVCMFTSMAIVFILLSLFVPLISLIIMVVITYSSSLYQYFTSSPPQTASCTIATCAGTAAAYSTADLCTRSTVYTGTVPLVRIVLLYTRLLYTYSTQQVCKHCSVYRLCMASVKTTMFNNL